MKFVKVIFISIAVIVVVALLGIGIFLKTFDLNKYLPQITQQASKTIGRPVSIEKGDLNLSLSGVVLDLGNINVGEDPKAAQRVSVKAAGAHMALDVMALISRHEIAVRTIELKHASLSFIDANPALPINLQVSDINVTVDNFTLNAPFKFTVDAMLYSNASNVYVEGLCVIDMAKAAANLSNINIKTELAQLNLDQLKSVTPLLTKIPLPKSVRGKVLIAIPQVEVSAKGAVGLLAHVNIADGEVVLEQLLSPIAKINAKADVDLKDINAISLEAIVASGKVLAHGDLKDYAKVQIFESRVELSGIKLEELINQSVLPCELSGKLAGKIDIAGEGFEPTKLIKNLKGQGTLDVSEGIIQKMNIAKMALGNTLKNIPGLADQIDGLITGALKDKVGADTTVIDKAHAAFTISDGVVHLDEALVNTKVFDFTAQGMVDSRLSVDIGTNLKLSEDVSASLAGQAKELAYLMGDDKRIAIPATLSGIIPTLKYAPTIDLKKVGQNALVDEGGKQLQKVIEKNPEVGSILNAVFGSKDKAADQPQDNTQTQQPTDGAQQEVPVQGKVEKTKKLIGNILGSILK